MGLEKLSWPWHRCAAPELRSELYWLRLKGVTVQPYTPSRRRQDSGCLEKTVACHRNIQQTLSFVGKASHLDQASCLGPPSSSLPMAREVITYLPQSGATQATQATFAPQYHDYHAAESIHIYA